MPLTKSGKKVMEHVQETYGAEKGKGIFYAMINEGKKGSEKWHVKSKGKGKTPEHNSFPVFGFPGQK